MTRGPQQERHSPGISEAPQFVPPETLGRALELGDDEAPLDIESLGAWDIAARYHEFKARLSRRDREKVWRKISAAAILDRAKAILGSVVHPVVTQHAPADGVPGEATLVEFEFEETIEHSPDLSELWYRFDVRRKQSVVIAVDTSLSMTGEKLALTAVALSVVLLEFPDDPIGIVAFENEAVVLKRPEEKIGVLQVVERFLDVPAQGYTHLEEGLRGALRLVRESGRAVRGRTLSTVVLTDGKYTAGRDPSYLAPRFPHLVVLKMGKERASWELCEELARGGRGSLREVGELEALPTVMYGVVKDLLRGRSA